MPMTTWKKEIERVMEDSGDTIESLISCTLTEDEMNVEFSNDYGGICGLPFTAWSEKFVYFPVCYDGSEWCGSVARNPDGVATAHVGGG